MAKMAKMAKACNHTSLSYVGPNLQININLIMWGAVPPCLDRLISTRNFCRQNS